MPDHDTASRDAASRRAASPVPYDFRRPSQLSRESTRILEMVFETVARQWATVLGSALGVQCQVVFGGVEQRSYDDYISGLPSPTLLSVFDPQPHAGHGFLQLDLGTGYTAVERMLGGAGVEQPDRIPTEVETSLLRRLAERLLAEVPYGLQAVTELVPTLSSLEFNPQFVQVAAAMDMFVVATFHMTIDGAGDAAPATATFALPAPLLTVSVSDGAAAVADAETLAARRQARLAMTQAVCDVSVEVRVRFVPLRLPSSAVMRLRVGEVVRLDHPVERPLDVVASGSVCARGVAGTQGSRAACLIVSSAPSGKAQS